MGQPYSSLIGPSETGAEINCVSSSAISGAGPTWLQCESEKVILQTTLFLSSDRPLENRSTPALSLSKVPRCNGALFAPCTLQRHASRVLLLSCLFSSFPRNHHHRHHRNVKPTVPPLSTLASSPSIHLSYLSSSTHVVARPLDVALVVAVVRHPSHRFTIYLSILAVSPQALRLCSDSHAAFAVTASHLPTTPVTIASPLFYTTFSTSRS